MVIFTDSMLDKLGDNGFRELELSPESETFSVDEMKHAVLNTPNSLLLWHGVAPVLCEELLSLQSTLWVLAVSTPGVHDVSTLFPTPPERVIGLKWGLKSYGDWDRHRPWQRDRLKQFVAATVAQPFGPPRWDLLEPPSTPEYVLSCYIAVFTGQPVDGSWRAGFEEDVAKWAKPAGVALDWDAATDIAKLRQFLLEAQVFGTDATAGR